MQIGSRRDATEGARQHREEDMEIAHANRVATMAQLSASIAHEVSQPIAAVVLNAEAALRWLSAAPPNLEEVRAALERIVQDGNRAGELIGGMRAFIKKAPPRQDGLEINDAILEVLGLAHGEVVKHRIAVRTQLADNLPTLRGDRIQLQQVLLNLIVNAVEAMSGTADGPRELQIDTAEAGPGSVRVAVRDSGPGLPPAGLKRLFEPFYTTKPGGLGMGLLISRSIVEAHGGRLWASVNEPRGASFTFTLPTQEE
jgi:C4-dicarboxylate-specific signal transduction histidine kinase